MNCGPHQSKSGKRFAKRNRTIIFKLGDHSSVGPSAVLPQLKARIRSLISDPPGKKESTGWPALAFGTPSSALAAKLAKDDFLVITRRDHSFETTL